MEHLECKNVNKQKTMVLKVVGKKAVWIFFRLKKKKKNSLPESGVFKGI